MERKHNTVSELAKRVGGTVIGDGTLVVHRIADLETAAEGDIAFVENEKFFHEASESKASCIIVPAGADVNAPCRIEVKNPKLAFALIAEVLHPPKRREFEIHSSAVIAENAKIAGNVFIGAFVCIGVNSAVGSGTQIRAGAKIGDKVTVGSDCV